MTTGSFHLGLEVKQMMLCTIYNMQMSYWLSEYGVILSCLHLSPRSPKFTWKVFSRKVNRVRLGLGRLLLLAFLIIREANILHGCI